MIFLAYGMAMIGDVQNSLTHVLQVKQKKNCIWKYLSKSEKGQRLKSNESHQAIEKSAPQKLQGQP